MARNPQSFAKRAREIAVKERRDRKRARKSEAAAQRALDTETAEPDATSEAETRR
jgi:hypothetical protein